MSVAQVSVGDVIRREKRRLTSKFGAGEADAMMRAVFHALKGWSRTDMIVNEIKPISDFMAGRVAEIVDRVLAGEPLQYILGEAYFYGMDLAVRPGVLIPRPETEELVDMIVKENPGRDLRVLDVGTGSGCIAIALARNLEFPMVTAIDCSEAALEIARENAAKLHARIEFKRKDVFEYMPESDSLDIIVSNPPYIDESEAVDMEENVVKHEPHLALFVPDSDPLCYYRRIARMGVDALSPGGKIYFEINPRHSEEMIFIMRDLGYKDIEVIKDIHGRDRFLKAIKAL